VVAAEARRMRAADAYGLPQGWRVFLLPRGERQVWRLNETKDAGAEMEQCLGAKILMSVLFCL